MNGTSSGNLSRAAVLFGEGRGVEMIEVKLPDVGSGQVAVQVVYSGVCQSQLMEVHARRGVDPYLPHMLGHEGSGVVIEVGHGVTKVKPGDRVILSWIKGSGMDIQGTTYMSQEGPINGGPITTFNERAVLSENRLVPLPDGVPMDVAALFGCALLTGGGVVLNELDADSGSTLAIFGLGGIGLCALMVAVASGKFSKVIGIDVEDEKLLLAQELGATVAVDARDDALLQLREMTDGHGVDFSVECSGRVGVIEMAFDAVRRNGGLCVFASHPPEGDVIRLNPFELINGKRIRGSWGGASNPDLDIPHLAEMYRGGGLPLEKLLSKRYQLDQINEALADLEAGQALRPLIEIEPTAVAKG